MTWLNSIKIISISTMALFFGCQDPENEPNLNERAKAIMARIEESEGGRLEGVVLLFNKEKAYGFIEISGNEGGTDRGIYFGYSAIAGTTYNKLKVGDLVNFEISVDEAEPKARSVSIVTSDEELNANRQAFAKEQEYIANYCSPDKETECTIRRIIAASLGVPFQKAMKEATYADNLGADSLHIVELIMALEGEFDLEILDKDLELMPTVGDTIDYIARRKQETANR